ncbi:MAG TPA: hypothetical protein VI409_03670 [Gaiellaceae bacterium]|nr:hypothetical protein [Gaiellaceae bacterium]
MREESHLDDMRSAIRGDFARLADRRGEQELMRIAPAPHATEPEDVPSVEEPDTRHRSWLGRLLSS